jgi:hypothetical protein
MLFLCVSVHLRVRVGFRARAAVQICSVILWAARSSEYIRVRRKVNIHFTYSRDELNSFAFVCCFLENVVPPPQPPDTTSHRCLKERGIT